MNTFKGVRAQRLVEDVAAQLAGSLPASLETVLVGVRPRGGLVVKAVAPGESREGLFDAVHTTRRTDARGGPSVTVSYEGPTYLGTWLPLPRGTVLARINAQGAAEAVQEAVEGRLGQPWPFEGAAVKTKCEGAHIHGWFHDGQGGRICLEFRVRKADCLS